MKKTIVALMIACLRMSTVDAEEVKTFIQTWSPTSAYEKSIKISLKEIEDNPAVQEIAREKLDNLESVDMETLKKAHEHYEWGIFLLKRALEKKLGGGSNIKNSSDRKELELLLSSYASRDKIIQETLYSRVREQAKHEMDVKKIANRLIKALEDRRAQKIVEKDKRFTLDELDFAIENLKREHRKTLQMKKNLNSPEEDNELFLKELSGKVASDPDHDYSPFEGEVSSIMRKAQSLRGAYEDDDNNRKVEASLYFLNKWHDTFPRTDSYA